MQTIATKTLNITFFSVSEDESVLCLCVGMMSRIIAKTNDCLLSLCAVHSSFVDPDLLGLCVAIGKKTAMLC